MTRYLYSFAMVLVVACSVRLAHGQAQLTAEKTSAGAINLLLSAKAGTFYEIEASSNLRDWSPIATVRATTLAAPFADVNGAEFLSRYYRAVEVTNEFIMEGFVRTPDGRGIPASCPYCDIKVSSSLTATHTYTDRNGRYLFRLPTPPLASELPFTLNFFKIGYRTFGVTVSNVSESRLDLITLVGPPNNDFTNRQVLSGLVAEGQVDNSQADVEVGEPGEGDFSTWFSFTAPASGVFRFSVDTDDFLPVINLLRGTQLNTLQPLAPTLDAVYQELHMARALELPMASGEACQIRVAARPHPFRDLELGQFSWRAELVPNFPLEIKTNEFTVGAVTAQPLPGPDGRYVAGTEVTLSATYPANYGLAGWSGAVGSAQQRLTFTMNGPKAIEPVFRLLNGASNQALALDWGTSEEFVAADNRDLWFTWTAPSDMPTIVKVHSLAEASLEIERLNSGSNNEVLGAGDGQANFNAAPGGVYRIRVSPHTDKPVSFSLELFEPIVIRGRIATSHNADFEGEVSTSLDGSVVNVGAGSYELRTSVPHSPTNFPFTLFITPINWATPFFAPYQVTVTEATTSRSDYVPLLVPANNFVSSAEPITGTSAAGRGTIYYADVEPGEPGTGDASVWYSYVAPGDGTILFASDASGVSVFSGTTLATLRPQESKLLGEIDSVRTWEVPVSARVEYRIRVDDIYTVFSGFAWALNFAPHLPIYIQASHEAAGRVEVSPASPDNRYPGGSVLTLRAVPNPSVRFTGWTGDVTNSSNEIQLTVDRIWTVKANYELINDHFANAAELIRLPATAERNNALATVEPGEPHAASSWWRWTAPSNMSVQLDLNFTDFDAVVLVYTGESLSNLTLVANNLMTGNQRKVRFEAEAGKTYRIAVTGSGPVPLFSFVLSENLEPLYELSVESTVAGAVSANPPLRSDNLYVSGAPMILTAAAQPGFTFDGWYQMDGQGSRRISENATLVVVVNTDNRLFARYSPIP